MSAPAPSPRLHAVLLDTGPLGLLVHTKAGPDTVACRAWTATLAAAGARVIVPEIADYELRRELLLARLTRSLRALDLLAESLDYLPLDTAAMRQAANFWAQARQAGRPTADRHALDADVVLAAQAVTLGYPPGGAVVATGNVGHLAQFIPAQHWQDITL